MNSNKNSSEYVALYAQWVVKHKYLSLVISILVFLLAASGMKNLAFTSSYKVFFSEANPFLESYETMQDVYSSGDSALIVVAPKDGKVFSNSFLLAIEELTKDAWQVPSVYRVDSITNFQHTQADQDNLTIAKLIPDAAGMSNVELDYARKVATSEPLLVNRIISKEAHVTAVNVAVRLPDGDDLIVAEVASSVRELRDKYEERYPELDIYLTGVAMMSNAFPEISIKEMSTTTPTMFLIVLIFCFVVLRSFTGTISTFLVIVFSIATALGVAGHMGIKLNQVSANIPVIVLTLAVADSIHIFTTILHQMKLGDSRNDAIVESLRVNFAPVAITSITTAVGFLGLNLSDAPPFHDLGNITAVGMFAAFFYSIFLLPALAAISPMRTRTSSGGQLTRLSWLSDWVLFYRTKLLYGTVAFSVLMIALIPRLTVDENFVDNFAPGLEIRDHSDFTMDNLTGLFNMEFSLSAGSENSINSPEYMEKVDEFAKWSRLQSGVLNVNAVTDTLKRINKSMNGDDDEHYKLPISREVIAQYLLTYEMSLPLGLELNDQIDIGRSATKVTVTFDDLSTFEMQRAKEQHEQWLRDNAPSNMHAEAASASLMYTYLMNTNIKGLLAGTAISFLIITLCLGIIFGSVKYALISVLPNVLPISIAFGMWSIIDGVVGVAAATIATMTLGIVVDDTVHFVSKYLRARRELDMSPEQSVGYAFSTVGVALISTSTIFAFGFGSMIGSDFLMNAQMGIFTVMTVLFALVLDFFLLPTLLVATDIGEGSATESPESPEIYEPLMKRV